MRLRMSPGSVCHGRTAWVSMTRRLCALVLYAAFADAIPTITFPINSQVPPVARSEMPFTFTFSYSTFSSSLPLTYTLSNAPSWLSLDGNSRTLSGTPPTSAANTAPVIQINAMDSTGSVSMTTTLVVTGGPPPQISIPLDAQLANFGAYSAPNSLLFYPSTPFKFSFNPRTFTSGSDGTSGLNYYAVTLENTPLPSWVTFDADTLTFSGQTPDSASLIQPPQNFGIQLIASEVVGFSGSALPYYIVVENHRLDFVDSFLSVNATPGTPLDFTGLSGSLMLDGKLADASNISSITAKTPSWLVFNNSSLVLSGTPPSDAASFNVSITATDVFSDTAQAIVSVLITNSTTAVFNTNDIGPLNATIGMPFSHNFSSIFTNASSVIVSADISSATTWLSFDAQTLTLSGKVPSTAQLASINITIQATPRTKRASDSLTFTLNVVAATGTLTTFSVADRTSSTAQAESQSATATTTPASAASNSSGVSKGALVAAILVPILVLLIALLALFFCCFRRRRAQVRSASPAKSDISGPVQQEISELDAARIAQEKVHPSMRYGPVEDAGYTDPSFVGTKRQPTTIRRSQTESGLYSYISSGNMRDSQYSAGQRGRSLSENALSSLDSSWRSTQESAYPPIASTSSSSGRITRNFSRKTGVARLTRDDSSEFPIRNSNMSFMPFRRISESGNSIQQTPEFAYDTENMRMIRDSKRRTPNYLGGVPNIPRRQSGIGHGSRDSTSLLTQSVLSVMSANRRSGGVGHGSVPSSYNFARDSNSWMTIGTERDRKSKRPLSAMSAVTESTDVLYPGSPERDRKTIRLVQNSPKPALTSAARNSFSSSTRASKRANGFSPFFAGSERANSRAMSRRSDKSKVVDYGYSDESSPAVPNYEMTNENLASSIMRQLRSPAPQDELAPVKRDILGISYGDPSKVDGSFSSPLEGTRQLQSYVSGMGSPMDWQRDSRQFSDNDSRFISADHSPDSQQFEIRDDYEDDGHEYYGHSPYAHGSPRTFRDSKGNSIRYLEDNESPELGQAVVERPSLMTPYLSNRSNPVSPGLQLPGQERFVLGPNRRPVSVDPGLKGEHSFSASQFEEATLWHGDGDGDGKEHRNRSRQGSDVENDAVVAFL